MSKLVGSGLNAGVLAEFMIDWHSSASLTNRRDIRQTYEAQTCDTALYRYRDDTHTPAR